MSTRNWLIGSALGGPLAASTVIPFIGPVSDYMSGDWKREAQDAILQTTPDPETGYKVDWFNKLLHGKDAFTPEGLDKRKDARARQIIEKDPALQKLISDHGYTVKPGDTATSIKTDLADAEVARVEGLKSDILLGIEEKRRKAKQSDPWAIEDRAEAKETNRLQREELKLAQDFRRYQAEMQNLDRVESRKSEERRRQERRQDKRELQADRKLARQESVDLALADLAFKKGESNRNYDLQVQKINRDTQLAHQAKIANIAAGIGALAMGFAV